MCNCKTEIEANLLEHVKQQLPESTGHHVEIGGYVLGFKGDAMFSCQSLPVTIKHTVTMKKTGLPKQKVEKQNMMARYCMFCGEKRAED